MTWVFWLRSVNVGGHNRLPMAELRALVTELGGADVRTFIQSGNVVCTLDPRPVEPFRVALADAVEARFGFSCPVVARAAPALREALAHDPFPEVPDKRWALAFLGAAPDPARAAVLERWLGRDERLSLRGTDLYLHLPAGVGGTQLTSDRLDRALGTVATLRNRATVRAVAELAGA